MSFWQLVQLGYADTACLVMLITVTLVAGPLLFICLMRNKKIGDVDILFAVGLQVASAVVIYYTLSKAAATEQPSTLLLIGATAFLWLVHLTIGGTIMGVADECLGSDEPQAPKAS